jgi:hypothetical protein
MGMGGTSFSIPSSRLIRSFRRQFNLAGYKDGMVLAADSLDGGLMWRKTAACHHLFQDNAAFLCMMAIYSSLKRFCKAPASPHRLERGSILIPRIIRYLLLHRIKLRAIRLRKQ